MKKIKLFIIPIVALMTLVSVSSLYAVAKPDAAVYGIYSETYPGVVWFGSGDNRIDIYPWEGTIDIIKDKSGGSLPDIAAEGKEYMRFKYNTTDWVGFGYTRVNDGIIDMSEYKGGKVKFSARSNKPEEVKNGYVFFETSTKQRSSSNAFLTGLTTEWKEFEFDIPATGIDLDKVSILFAFVQDSSAPAGETSVLRNGNFIDIDNIRWVKSDVIEMDVKDVSFEAELKNGSEITWGEDVFQTGWKISDQYIDLKCKLSSGTGAGYTAYVSTRVAISNSSLAELSKWKVKIYTSKSTSTKSGLLPYNNNKYNDFVNTIPLCWRISDVELTNFDIEEVIDEENNRHLQNADDKGWYCYFYMKNEGQGDYSVADKYSTIWSSEGCHVSEDETYGFNSKSFMVLPKLYIGANFKNSLGSTRYESTIIIEYHYDE